MIFPESVEDICLIVEMYGLDEEEIEAWMVSLTTYIQVLSSCVSQFQEEAEELRQSLERAREYSEECLELSRELSCRVKYDETLAVAVEELVRECSFAAGLVEQLTAQVSVKEVILVYLEYSEECLELSRELSCRVKYDETLAVAVEELVRECSFAAGLVEQLTAQVEELGELAYATEAHCRVVRTYRELLNQYLRGGDDEDDDDDDDDDYED